MGFCCRASFAARVHWLLEVAVAVALTAAVVRAAVPAGPASLTGEYSHRTWRVSDGLPQNRIQAVSQTSDGYLWIGTSGGLVRFDGVRFFVFDRSNTPAFRDDSILSLFPSRNGALWIGTEGGRLLFLRSGVFRAYGPEEGLTNGFVRALYEDAHGTLWIGTDRGFFCKRGDRIERLDDTPSLPVTAITNLTSDSQGRVWAASSLGLILVENGAARRYRPGHKVLDGVRGVTASYDGSLWLLSDGGVHHLRGEQLDAVHAFDRTSAINIAEDREHNLWIGTLGNGLMRTGPAGIAALRDPQVLPDPTVFSVFQDREGNIWVGTGDGLLRLSTRAVHVLTSRDGLADDNVSTIYESPDGTLWFTTIRGQVFQYTEGRVVPFSLPASAAGMRFRVVYQDRKGTQWLGAGNGILRLSGAQATKFTTADGIRSEMIRQFLEDRQGNLWIGLGSGLSRWDGSRFHNYYLEEGLSYGSVRVLALDRRGDLLVGTDAGLNRVHDRKFVAEPAFAALSGERIRSILEDDGGLWIGTRGGGIFRIRNGKTARITVRHGLLSNTIYQILDDGRGNLWMSSPAGVFSAPRSGLDSVADGKPGAVAVVPYGTAEGLESTQMNGGLGPAGLLSSTGSFWFPSIKGAVRIEPREVRIAHPSPVLIESITADEEPLPLSGNIVIEPGPGKLEIHYTAASLRTPDRLTFRYKLEGNDPDWSPASRARTAYYTNLPPGSYRFRVAVTDSATPGRASEASIAFTWRPHFYQTYWFYALCLMIGALLLWAALRMYASQTRSRYALLFAERTRLAREMHDTVIQGCAGLSTLLEAICSVQHQDPGRTTELLEHARVQARLTLDEARQAIWDLRHTQWNGNIAATLQDFARHLSAEKGVPIEVEVASGSPPVEERMLRSVLLIAREAIRNAANHADPRLIRIQVSFEGGELRLEVVDDGRGFSTGSEFAERKGHYGIVGMRERVEQLGGEFRLHSTPGRGTSVIARLPLAAGRRREEQVHSQS